MSATEDKGMHDDKVEDIAAKPTQSSVEREILEAKQEQPPDRTQMDDVVEKLISKMDEQFFEIKETLSFRKIVRSQNKEDASASRSTKLSPTEGPSSSKVHPTSSNDENMASVVTTKDNVGVAMKKFLGLKASRPLPPDIAKTYAKDLQDQILKTFSQKWYRGHLCCCVRDADLDHDSRCGLRQTLPVVMYYHLVITGIIPTSRVPWLIPLIWFILAVLKAGIALACVGCIILQMSCLMSNSCINASTGLKKLGALALYNGFFPAMCFVNIFVFAPLIQSRAARCLFSYVGHKRAIGLKCGHNVLQFFVILCSLVGAIFAGLPQPEWPPTWLYCFFELFFGLAGFSATYIVFTLNKAITISYADFAVDVEQAANQHLQLYTPGGNVEVELIETHKRIVSLSATITQKAQSAIVVPLVFAALFVIWVFFTGWKPWELIPVLIATIPIFILPAVLPVWFALETTWAVDMLSRLTSINKFLNLAMFVRHSPSGWMVNEDTKLSLGLLTKLSAGVALISFLGGELRYLSTTDTGNIALWAPQHFAYGSCSDGLWSGLEEHVDCGPPRSGCPLTCFQKYGDYLLLEASRECSEVDGYVEIRTQRACEIAFFTFERVRSNDTLEGPVPASVVISTEDTQLSDVSVSNMRCGAYAAGAEADGTLRDTFLLHTIKFPALMSAAAVKQSLGKLGSWARAFTLRSKYPGQRYAANVLCMASKYVCETKDPVHMRESTTCASSIPSAPNASWTVMSQPWANHTSVNFWNGSESNNNPAVVSNAGDCVVVELKSFGWGSAPEFGGEHVVLSPDISSRVDVTTVVRSPDCPQVHALVSVVTTAGKEKERRVLSESCGDEKGFQFKKSPGDQVHIVADISSGAFEVTICI